LNSQRLEDDRLGPSLYLCIARGARLEHLLNDGWSARAESSCGHLIRWLILTKADAIQIVTRGGAIHGRILSHESGDVRANTAADVVAAARPRLHEHFGGGESTASFAAEEIKPRQESDLGTCS